MTAIVYYRWSLLQPVVLTALAALCVVQDYVASSLVAVSVFLGLQYTVWTVYALYWSCGDGKGEDDARELASRAPVHLAYLNLPVCVVFGAWMMASLDTYYTNQPATVLSGVTGALYGLGVALLAAPVTIIIVRVWVTQINATLHALKQCGWVESAP